MRDRKTLRHDLGGAGSVGGLAGGGQSRGGAPRLKGYLAVAMATSIRRTLRTAAPIPTSARLRVFYPTAVAARFSNGARSRARLRP